jgi:hypothetical protein
MSESEALERRYRRLLACYPASHRALHGEEMIGVLLAAAPPGRRRPAIADAVDLIWGGLQTRIRTRWLAGVETSWPDAFAVASIIIPVLLVIYFGAWMWLGIFRHSLSDLVALLFAALPPMLALRGYRRAGALTALIPVVFLGFIGAHFVGHPAWISGQVAGLALAFLLTAGAIAFSAGPSRGLHIMTARTWIVVCGTGLAVVAREAVVGRLYLEPAGAPVPG